MKRLTALFVIFTLVLMSAPLFAGEGGSGKVHPSSPFNVVEGWFSSLGTRSDGTPVWEFKMNDKSTLSDEEVMGRRESVGAGMRGRCGVK